MQNVFLAAAAFFIVLMFIPEREAKGIVDIPTVEYDTFPMFHEFEYMSDSSLDDIVYRIDTIQEKLTRAASEWKLLEKEWFPYRGLTYSYKPVDYDSIELLAFTNIIYRESGTSPSKYSLGALNDAIDVDRYLVGIVALRTIHSNKAPFNKINRIYDVLKSRQFPYDKSLEVKTNKEWLECLEVAKKVLRGDIPKYVPYIPKGTFCYWNTRIDTNKKQKKYLETKGVHVASSVKDHHYFAIIDYMEDDEIEMIKNSPCSNAAVKGGKTIKAGILCNETLN